MTETGYQGAYGNSKAKEMLDLNKDFGDEIRAASARAVEK